MLRMKIAWFCKTKSSLEPIFRDQALHMCMQLYLTTSSEILKVNGNNFLSRGGR